MPTVYAKRKWGQNFLTDANLLEKIVRTLDLSPEDRLLEIGPGEGALTERILPRVSQLAAIEVDPRLVDYLREQPELTSAHIVHGDVLWQQLAKLRIDPPLKIVGNIPYNITSPILFWLIEQRHQWTEATLMVQKELADRLTADVGTRTYGRLTVMIRAFLNVEQILKIPPDVFVPRPKVMSVLIRLTQRKTPLLNDDQFDKFERLVATAFSSRRKMLRNTLKGFRISENIKKDIDFSRRPETLTAEEFVKLL